jgi:hypothetical protein
MNMCGTTRGPPWEQTALEAPASLLASLSHGDEMTHKFDKHGIALTTTPIHTS